MNEGMGGGGGGRVCKYSVRNADEEEDRDHDDVSQSGARWSATPAPSSERRQCGSADDDVDVVSTRERARVLPSLPLFRPACIKNHQPEQSAPFPVASLHRPHSSPPPTPPPPPFQFISHSCWNQQLQSLLPMLDLKIQRTLSVCVRCCWIWPTYLFEDLPGWPSDVKTKKLNTDWWEDWSAACTDCRVAL